MNSLLCKNVVVDKNHYYIDGEIEKIKSYVLEYMIKEKEQKLNKINSKLKNLRR